MLTPADHVRSLLGAYCRLLDAGDLAGVGRLLGRARLLTEDGAPIAAGAEAVEALYAALVRRHADGTPRTQHVVVDTELSRHPAPDGPRLRARSSYVVLQQVPGVLPLQPVVTGSYDDLFACDPDAPDLAATDGWHLVERRFGIRLTGQLAHHLAVPLPLGAAGDEDAAPTRPTPAGPAPTGDPS